MGLSFNSLLFFTSSLFFLQRLELIECHLEHMKQVSDSHPGEDQDSDKITSGHDSHMEPELHVFFHYNALKQGTTLQLYFPKKKSPNTSPHFLSKPESESIPFSTSHLHYILKLFEFPTGSHQATAVETTLRHCEFPPMNRETKFCATSLEAMLDSVRGVYGSGPEITVLTTKYVDGYISNPLQNYTVSENVEEIRVRRIVACHMMPYPYAVFYCHSQEGDTVLYRVVLVGEDGGRVDAIGMCHMDTSRWDHRHVAFRVLNIAPGASSVCHFFPIDNLVWVPN